MTTPAPTALHPARIHPSAVVEDGAVLGHNVEIGPFCHIGSKVTLGANVQVMSHVVIVGNTTIGERSVVFPNAVLGCAPQNVHYKGEDTELVVGAGCTIREGVTMHPGMPDFGGKTMVGDNSMFLAYSHVAHDCHVGSNVILSNNVMLAGHVSIGDRVIMGGGAAVHQFTRIGHHAFIGGLAAVSNDVIPYGMLNGNPGVLMGLNIIGMQRSGFDKASIHAVRRAYKTIFDTTTPIRENIARVREQSDLNSAVADIIGFIDAESERALSSPARGKRGLKPVTAAARVPAIKGRLGILAGRGSFPRIVANAARELAHNPFVFIIDGEADQDWSGYDTAALNIGNLSAFMDIVHRESIGAVVLTGGIARRPGLRDIRPTWAALKSAPFALKALLSGGDDKILRAAIHVLETHGVRVLGAQEIAPHLLGGIGPLGDRRPGKSDQTNIAAATQAALALGRLDIGQGAVAVGGRVIALEGLEGTDAMLTRVASLRADGRLRAGSRGVLVKLCKPGQEQRADLPAIGPDTVLNAHAAGLAGIAIEAGRSLVLEGDQVIAEANRLGLFVTGLELDWDGRQSGELRP